MPDWDAEVRVDEALARRLIAEQFPELDMGKLRLLGEGWDTIVWLVDGRWVFRYPRRAMVISGLELEMRYLPELADRLPLPIPRPMLFGEPSDAYRWPFYGAPFVPGRELADTQLDDKARIALGRSLGEFLRALHSLEPYAGLPVDPVHRADMDVRVPHTRQRFDELEQAGLWTAPAAAYEIVAAAAELGPPEPTAIVHGDFHLRHLLVDDEGRASAVIDWIDLSRNDPGVDLASTGRSCRRKEEPSFARRTASRPRRSFSADASCRSSCAPCSRCGASTRGSTASSARRSPASSERSSTNRRRPS